MPVNDSEIAKDSKEALRLYILELQADYYTWYDRASARAKYWWVVGQTIVIAAGVLTAGLAALLNSLPPKDSWLIQVLQVLLVILPIIGVMASTILLQTRATDLVTLRSIGREQIQNLIAHAKASYAEAGNDQKRLYKIHTELAAEVSRVERTQAVGFCSMLSGQFQAPTLDREMPPNQSVQTTTYSVGSTSASSSSPPALSHEIQQR
jgi:hypothetical protein